jgi:hypothetical protein
MLKLSISCKDLPDGHAIHVAPMELSSIFPMRSYKDVAPTELLRSHRLVTFFDSEHDIRSRR